LNHFKERGDDVDQPTNITKNPLHVPNRPMTQSKTKALKEALNALVLNVLTKLDLKALLEYQEEALVHLIHVQEELNPTLFGP
jgi:hypothetical protein